MERRRCGASIEPWSQNPEPWGRHGRGRTLENGEEGPGREGEWWLEGVLSLAACQGRPSGPPPTRRRAITYRLTPLHQQSRSRAPGLAGKCQQAGQVGLGRAQGCRPAGHSQWRTLGFLQRQWQVRDPQAGEGPSPRRHAFLPDGSAALDSPLPSRGPGGRCFLFLCLTFLLSHTQRGALAVCLSQLKIKMDW